MQTQFKDSFDIISFDEDLSDEKVEGMNRLNNSFVIKPKDLTPEELNEKHIKLYNIYLGDIGGDKELTVQYDWACFNSEGEQIDIEEENKDLFNNFTEQSLQKVIEAALVSAMDEANNVEDDK